MMKIKITTNTMGGVGLKFQIDGSALKTLMKMSDY